MQHPFRVIALVGLWLCLTSGLAIAAERRLTFLHFNDVYEFQAGRDSGGLAGLQSLILQERHTHPDAILTFGGDLISPSLASGLTQGSHMIDMVNQMAPIAAVLGNHEFDFGADIARQRIKESRFPWLVGNVDERDGNAFAQAPRLLMIERQGIKIGLFGILTVESASLSAGGKEIRFTEEMASARQLVKQLRFQGAQVVVALTHQDFSQDLAMARQVGGIDVILGGHDHEAMTFQAGDTVIIKAGANAEYLAAVDVLVKDGKARPLGWRLTSSLGQIQDAKLARLAAKYTSLVDQDLGQPLANLEVPLDSRQATNRAGESSFGDLVADSLRHALDADIALVNGGGLRGDRQYEAGTSLSRADLMAEMPFGNKAMLLEVDGATLLAALENGISKAPALAGRFPQVSGLAFTYAPRAEPGQRLRHVTVHGQAVQPDRLYRLATSNYLAEGGDGYAMLENTKRLINAEAADLLVNLVAEHLHKLGQVPAPTTGRIGAVD
ncbi:MAG: bifunctional UDP-sugar hydrolase/5'-nucleotidase [Magnetospirillum sp.]